MAIFFTLMLIIGVIFPFQFKTITSAVDSISTFQSIADGTTLVSKEGSFELGFFGRGGSKNRYVGIWYRNIPIQTVVWVANRCNPVTDSPGLLTLNGTGGNLVLLSRNKSVVWSTGWSKQVEKPIVQLLESGNLVIRDEKDSNSEGTNYLWQSFDYPSDAILPGMKFGWDLKSGLKRRLSAWKNWDNPCPGDLTYGIEFDPQRHTYPDFYLRKGATEIYRTGPWNGIRLSGAVEQRPNLLYGFEFVFNNDEVYYTYHLKNKSVISRIVINQSTSSRERLAWVEEDQAWKSYASSNRDNCDNYGICGANANCNINKYPICQCLRGFKPKSPGAWNLQDWSKGCVRNNPLTCLEKYQDGFIQFSGLKLPDTSHSWVNESMNIKECRSKCLSDCSCTAYTNSDIRGKGSGCAIWFGNLLDMRQFPDGGQDLFIRMPRSELGKGRDDNKMRTAIVVAVILGASGMPFIVYCIVRRGSKENTDRHETISLNGDREEELELPFFNLSAITTATENFSADNKLGEGGFGPVYRGQLEDGQEIAVKRLSINSEQGLKELKNEVKLIAKLQHRNLVKLLGSCIQGEEKLLVYEYMSNKGLDSFIFDFGLARIFGGDQAEEKTNRVIGTYGYMAPEYILDGLFSIKSDVFSFGILVLEIVSGMKSRGFHHQNHGLTLIGRAWTLYKEGNSFDLLDKHVRESEHNLKEVFRCIHVGLLCVQQSPVDRPNMSSVVVFLGSESDLPQPKAPGYFTEIDTKPESSTSRNHMSISLLNAR